MAGPLMNVAFPKPGAIGSTPATGGVKPGGNGPSFADMMAKIARESVASANRSEQEAITALSKRNDLVDVVSAVTNAEVTLETAIAVRDRVIQAYQQIIRMPI